jgi:hypothetical protein
MMGVIYNGTNSPLVLLPLVLLPLVHIKSGSFSLYNVGRWIIIASVFFFYAPNVYFIYALIRP